MTKDEIKARYKQAGLLYVMREFKDACEILDELLRLVPGNKELLVAKARCLSAMGLRKEAKAICNLLVSASNANPDADIQGSESYSQAS